MSGYYEVCRFNGAALTLVLPDSKTDRKTVCRLREFAGGKLAELWCGEEGKLVFCKYWGQPEFVPLCRGTTSISLRAAYGYVIQILFTNGNATSANTLSFTFFTAP